MPAGTEISSAKAALIVGSTPITRRLALFSWLPDRQAGQSGQAITGLKVASWPAVDTGHARSGGDDRADGLVAHDLTRDAPPVLAGEAVEVGAADAGGGHLEQDLARARDRVGPILDGELPRTLVHQRLHGDLRVSPG